MELNKIRIDFKFKLSLLHLRSTNNVNNNLGEMTCVSYHTLYTPLHIYTTQFVLLLILISIILCK